MASLEGCNTKLDRAHHHLTKLEEQVLQWFNGDHHTVIHERRGDSASDYQVRVEIDDLPSSQLAVIVGDILHNIRSSLDHLAFSLADTYSTLTGAPKDFERDSEFPIFGDEDRSGNSGAGPRLFQQAATRKIGAVDPAVQAIIERLQPYHRGNGFYTHPLWQLSELSNIDKHRLLHPVIYEFGGMEIRRDMVTNVRLHGQFEVFKVPVVNNAILAIYSADPIDPNREMNMDFNPILDIAFDQSTCVANQNARKVLGAIYNYVLTEVLPPLTGFVI